MEGILGQLVFMNQYLRKLCEIKDLPGQENMSDADRFAAMPPLTRAETQKEMARLETDQWRPLKAVGGRQIGWLFPGENLAGVQTVPLIIVNKTNALASGPRSIEGVWIREDGERTRVHGLISEIQKEVKNGEE